MNNLYKILAGVVLLILIGLGYFMFYNQPVEESDEMLPEIYADEKYDDGHSGPSRAMTQAQAEALVFQKWSDCSQGDCSSVSVTLAPDRGEQYLITAIFTQLDDSVSQSKRESLAVFDNGVWILGEPVVTYLCHRGNVDGTTGWTAGLCI